MKKVLSFVIAAAMTVSSCGICVNAENDEYIVNGGFDSELYGEGNWKFPKSGGWYTEGVAQIVNGQARIKNGLLYQRVNMKRNTEYKLQFRAKANRSADIDVVFNDGAAEWPAVNGIQVDSAAVNTEWQTISVTFKPQATQDYVVTIGKWDETLEIDVDDVTMTEEETYIGKVRAGVDGNGVISYKTDYTANENSYLVTALYDEKGNLIGAKAKDNTGYFKAAHEFGTYTVKSYLIGNDILKMDEAEIVYDENSKENENQSLGPAKTVEISKDKIDMAMGDTAILDALITPEFAYNKDIVWTSSDENIASVSANGTVTATGEGTAVITAQTSDGILSDTCEVKVHIGGVLNTLSLSETDITLPEKGAVSVIEAVTVPKKEVVWKSSDEDVATVNNGVITSVNPGKAVITATSEGKSSKCTVTVKKIKNLITNDSFYKDTEGNPIYSQGGGIYKYGDTYYWYGVKYKEAPIYAANPENGAAGNAQFEAVTCYTSKNLTDWEFAGYPITKNTEGIQEGWFGRLGVAYNENTKKYVLISQAVPGMLFATSDTPAGPFKVDHFKTDLDCFVNNGTGDQTVFQDDDGKAYLICSSVKGREHLYVAPLRESDFLDIDEERIHEIYFDENGEYTAEDGTTQKRTKGIEGNCMFRYNDSYYFTGSDLYGWNASRVYYFKSDEILGDYNSDTHLPKLMPGAASSFAHGSQAGFYVTVHGSEKDLVIYCGDRWGDFAGNGVGFNQWVPITIDEKGIPHFNDLHQWTLDSEKGTWKVADGNNYIHNPEFEADRKAVKSPTGYEVYDNIDGFANINISARQSTGNFVWQQGADEPYTALLKQKITDLPDGTYTFRAWVKSSGGQNICRLYAKSGDKEYISSIKNEIADWKEIVVAGDIEVKNGECEIGLYSDSPADKWVQIDNLSLVKNVE